MYDVADFIGDLEVAFSRYPSKDPLAEQRWVDLVKRKLGSFKPATLQAASETMVTTRAAKGFPALAEMIRACEKAVPPGEGLVVEPDLVREGKAAEAWNQGEAFWEKCMASERRPEIFVTAAKENWIMCLKSFIVATRRMPDAQEILDCKAEAVMFLEAYEECVRGGPDDSFASGRSGLKTLTVPYRALEGLGGSMLKRRYSVIDETLGRRSQ